MNKVQKQLNENVAKRNLEETARLLHRNLRSEQQKEIDFNERVAFLDEQISFCENERTLLGDERQRLVEKEKEILDREVALRAQEESFSVYFIEEKRKLSRAESELAQEKADWLAQESDRQSRLESINLSILNSSDNLKRTNFALEELQTEYEKIKSDLAKSTDIAGEELGVMLEALADIKKQIKELKQEVQTLLTQKQELIDNNADLLYNLSVKEQQLNTKEKNLGVHAKRIESLYEKHFNKKIKV